eukprot:SAG11_NODE_86_length_17300_cov_11.466717_16_plen_72_part_00
MFKLEDLLADVAEVRSSSPARVITKEMLYASTIEVRQRFAVVAKLDKLISVSDALLSDRSFARQIKRKFLS